MLQVKYMIPASCVIHILTIVQFLVLSNNLLRSSINALNEQMSQFLEIDERLTRYRKNREQIPVFQFFLKFCPGKNYMCTELTFCSN